MLSALVLAEGNAMLAGLAALLMSSVQDLQYKDW